MGTVSKTDVIGVKKGTKATVASRGNITKKQLIDLVVECTGDRKVDVTRVVKGFLDTVTEQLGQGNRIELRDFGVFDVKERAARVAQNPKTLEPVHVAAKRSVKFKAGRRMRDALEGCGAVDGVDGVDGVDKKLGRDAAPKGVEDKRVIDGGSGGRDALVVTTRPIEPERVENTVGSRE